MAVCLAALAAATQGRRRGGAFWYLESALIGPLSEAAAARPERRVTLRGYNPMGMFVCNPGPGASMAALPPLIADALDKRELKPCEACGLSDCTCCKHCIYKGYNARARTHSWEKCFDHPQNGAKNKEAYGKRPGGAKTDGQRASLATLLAKIQSTSVN